jgi:hypothetical protein
MTCVPASRTPEGDPGICPVCGDCFDVEPSFPSGDAPCPRCGCLVWVDEWTEPLRPLFVPRPLPVAATADIPPPVVDRDPVPVGMTLAGIMGELEALRSRLEAANQVRHGRGFRRLLDGLRSMFDASRGREKALSGAIETPGVWDRWIDGP